MTWFAIEMQEALGDDRTTFGQEGARALLTVRCVQWLRFIAAALVVLYHCEVQIMRIDSAASHSFGIGAAGVDLFFVISGFIMVHTTQRRAVPFRSFMRRRLIRIVPLYWVFTGLLVVLIAVQPSLFHSSALDMVHVLSSFAFLPYPHPVSGALRPLLVPGWTLNAEFFFYLCFGATLGLSLERRIIVISVLFAALIALSTAAPTASRLATFYGAPLMLEFVAGMTIAWLMQRPLASRQFPIVILGIGGVLAAGGILSGHSEQATRVVYWGGAATCTLYCCLWFERSRGWPDIPVMVRLGDASYAIYLSHLFVLGLAGNVVARLGLFDVLGANGLRAIMLLSAAGIGLAVHRWIEKPMLALLGRGGMRRGSILHMNEASNK